MNSLDQQLDRLFSAAASLPRAATPSLAFGLETRVLAAWSASRGMPLGWDMGVLVRGLALAGLLMVVSALPALSQRTNSDLEALQLADSTVQVDLAP